MTIINSVIKGKQPVIDTLNVTPTTSAQQITAPQGTDGYSPVNVSAVTSSIDANIVAGNIKNGVSILGVTGNYTGGGPQYYIEKTKDANNKLVNGSSVIDLTGVTDVGNNALRYIYYQNNNIIGAVDLSSLTTISGSYACASMFYNCTRITSVDLSSLTRISGNNACDYMFFACTNLTSIDLSALTVVSNSQCCINMFYGCTGITSVDLSSLTTVSNLYACASMFYDCTGITSVDLSSLTTISGSIGCSSMFYGCTSLTSVILSSLTNIASGSVLANMFEGCTSLTSLSFPALTSTSFGGYTNQFNNMLKNVTGCAVHFPSNLQSVIGSWASVTAGFGGTNTTVLFDLPLTAHLIGADTVEYERNPKYDTATALAWRVNGTMPNTTTYYTSGLTDPTVGTTIYSDSACTVTETIVASIA